MADDELTQMKDQLNGLAAPGERMTVDRQERLIELRLQASIATSLASIASSLSTLSQLEGIADALKSLDQHGIEVSKSPWSS